jgi:hypothetical protein
MRFGLTARMPLYGQSLLPARSDVVFTKPCVTRLAFGRKQGRSWTEILPTRTI